MAVHDGGGTFASGWAGTPVPTMWAALKDYDGAPHWKMVGAWQKSYELLLTHISQVTQYRDNLATAWPPHKSKAAAAYVQELNGLIENLQETYDAAISNHTALSTATLAVEEARRELDKIQQEHTANAGLLAEYNAQNPTPSTTSGSTPTPTPTPSPSPQTPPVVPGRQVQLQQQAAGIMQSLSAELATAQTSFVAPRPYEPFVDQSGTEGLSNGGGVGGGSASGLTPGFTPRGSTPTGSSNVTTPTTSDRTTVPDTSVDTSGPGNQPPSQGPTLVETNPTTNPNVTNPFNPTTPTNTTTLPPNTGSPAGPFPFTPSTNVTSPGVGGGRFTPATSGGIPTGTGATRGGSFPNNGVIGGSPAAGGRGGMSSGTPGGMPGGAGGRGGQAGSGARGGQRVNPAGGMIGGQTANGRGANGAGQSGMGGPPGRRGNGRNDEDPQNRRWDPDNPWETDDGVDPVLLPAQEQRIDPGPSIGGR